MKNARAALAILLTTLAATAAAQTATRAQQVRPVPQIRPTAPATRTSTAALQTTPYSTVSQQVIPANLFRMEDRAIIIVGGKQVVAGDVKRQLAAELRQTAGPVTTMRTASRLAGQPVRGGSFGGGFGPLGPLIKPGEGGSHKAPPPKAIRPPSDRIDARADSPSAAAIGLGRESAIAAKPALSYTEMKNYCKTHPIEISRVRGTVTPNGRFTIEGNCFGDTTGAVLVIGQFAGGNMKFVFESWNDVEIRAFVPAVSGVPDHVMSLTVERSDKARSPAWQTRFVATREIVPVPANYWTPSADFLKTDVDQGGGNLFTGFVVFGSGPAEARTAPFSLHVNPACGLESAGAVVRTGQVLAFNGWEDGPPYLANMNVAWTPHCVVHTNNYIVASDSERICSVDFTLSAQASCPVGVAP
ncbi:MAG TPA: hypothetical protein VGO61_02865 [Steroidobacteraceae bacterium]|nr:hypothetical protein [Steroidobacteraceae bacterium]